MKWLMNWCRQHPKAVFAVTTIVVALGLAGAAQVQFKIDTRQFMDLNEKNARNYQTLYEAFGSDNYGLVYLEDRRLLKPPNRTRIKTLEKKLSEIPAIQHVQSPLTQSVLQRSGKGIEQKPLVDEDSNGDTAAWNNLRDHELFRDHLVSANRRALVLVFVINPGAEDSINFASAFTKTIDNILEPYRQHFDTVFQISTPRLNDNLTERSQYTLMGLLPMSFALLISVLLFLFRHRQALFIPVLTSTLSIAILLGFMGLFSIPLHIITIIAPLTLVVVGATEDMHLLSEYQHNINEHGNRQRAVRELIDNQAIVILLTFASTAAGFGSVYFLGIRALEEFGLASAFGLFANFLITITLVPAYLSRYGTEEATDGIVDWVRRTLPEYGDFLLRHHHTILVVTVIVLGVATYGAFQITIDNDSYRYFTTDASFIQDTQRVSKATSGTQWLFLVVEHPDLLSGETLGALHELDQFIKQHQHLDYHLSLSRYLTIINQTLNKEDSVPSSRAAAKQYLIMAHQHQLKYLVSSDRSKTLFTIRYDNQGGKALQRWGQTLKHKAESLLPEGDAFTTGRALLVAQSSRQLAESQLYVIGGLGFFVALFMGFLFANPVMALVGFLPNILPALIYYGIMGWIGAPLDAVTAVFGGVVTGVAVDDTLHMMVRYSQFDGDLPSRINHVLVNEFIPVCSTTIGGAGCFLLFVMAWTVPPFQTFGLLSGATMLVAFVADMLLLPVLLYTAERLS